MSSYEKGKSRGGGGGGGGGSGLSGAPKSHSRKGSEHRSSTVSSSSLSVQNDEGVWRNSRFAHTMTSLVGVPVTVETLSDGTYEGILRTISRFLDVVLVQSTLVDKNNPNEIRQDTLEEKRTFRAKDIVRLYALDVDLDYATKKTFQTDYQISGKSNGPMRELEEWKPEEGDCEEELEGSLESSNNGWKPEDMFAKNEQNYGVKSTYKDNLEGYTCQLSTEGRDSLEYKQREAKAAEIARQIESNATSASAIELENGEGENEEEAFSAVARTASPHHRGGSTYHRSHREASSEDAGNNNNNSSNKYIPLSRRGPKNTPPHNARSHNDRDNDNDYNNHHHHHIQSNNNHHSHHHSSHHHHSHHHYGSGSNYKDDKSQQHYRSSNYNNSNNNHSHHRGGDGGKPPRISKSSSLNNSSNNSSSMNNHSPAAPPPSNVINNNNNNNSVKSKQESTPIESSSKKKESPVLTPSSEAGGDKASEESSSASTQHQQAAASEAVAAVKRGTSPDKPRVHFSDQSPSVVVNNSTSASPPASTNTSSTTAPAPTNVSSSTTKKSALNPNAKEFVLNPNAKMFTSNISRPPMSTTPSRPQTPATPVGTPFTTQTFIPGYVHHIPTSTQPNRNRAQRDYPRPELTSPIQVAAATAPLVPVSFSHHIPFQPQSAVTGTPPHPHHHHAQHGVVMRMGGVLPHNFALTGASSLEPLNLGGPSPGQQQQGQWTAVTSSQGPPPPPQQQGGGGGSQPLNATPPAPSHTPSPGPQVIFPLAMTQHQHSQGGSLQQAPPVNSLAYTHHHHHHHPSSASFASASPGSGHYPPNLLALPHTAVISGHPPMIHPPMMPSQQGHVHGGLSLTTYITPPTAAVPGHQNHLLHPHMAQ